MPAPQDMPGETPELNKPAFLGIGVALASSAIMSTGLAIYNLDRWDQSLSASTGIQSEQVLASGN